MTKPRGDRDSETSATWGGRFTEPLSALAIRFNASVAVDQRLAEQDIRGSRAHATMLAECGVISAEEHAAIDAGLAQILSEIREGKFEWSEAREDVHMNIEAELRARIGEAGAKLHTARSRNDQVATDLRLWTREALDRTRTLIAALQQVIVDRADAEIDTLMPGYTHLQRAQPVRLSHHLMAWVEMLGRDVGRLRDARARLNESPLGAAALAGTTFPIARERTAKLLGFYAPMRNSLDAVADRDFLVESVSALTICALHLSRIAEELVIWSSQEFGFVVMSDAYSTGSSIMPQKKNPDMAELTRGKTGAVVGALVNLVVMLKGLPLAYNRDLQEDKKPVFEAFDTIDDCLQILRGTIAELDFCQDAMQRALRDGFLDATEVADWLAARGVPFRDAHHVSGRLVRLAIAEGKTLAELSLAQYQAAHAAFDPLIYEALQMEAIVERRALIGGPAKAQVRAAIAAWRALLEATSEQPR